jgi:transposase
MWTDENRGRYDRSKLRYPSDLTDEEWELVAPLIPPARRGGGKRTVNMREVVNGLMYVLGTGCRWRAIPKDLPARSTVHGYLDLWDYDGTLQRLHHTLYVRCRERAGREPALRSLLQQAVPAGASHGVVQVKGFSIVRLSLITVLDRGPGPFSSCSRNGRITSHPVDARGRLHHDPSCLRASGSEERDHPFSRRWWAPGDYARSPLSRLLRPVASRTAGSVILRQALNTAPSGTTPSVT